MIEVVKLYKSFGNNSVLENISLKIEEGETFAIIGRSGSGKSVLMKHLIGLLTPDRGQVLIDGIDINELKYDELRRLRQNFGVLFQGGALFDSMNAFENVAFPLRTFSEKTDAEIEERARECLDMVELPHVGEQKTSELSGGQKKRVALARAVALHPRYILYDEPTSGLDPQTSNTIDRLIKNLANKLNVTSVVITHDMHSVISIADRAVYLNNQNVHWQGTVDELHASDDQTLLDFVTANEYQIKSSAHPRTEAESKL
jgi:phospholipid/cholesterol/gamma-HCH transport system ATP-binding protein